MPEHKNIADTVNHCHTPQGFSSASNDTVLSKNDSGNLEWISTPTIVEKARCCMYSAGVSIPTNELSGDFQEMNEATLGVGTFNWVEKLALPVNTISTDANDGCIIINKTGNFLLSCTINSHADGNADNYYSFTVGRYQPSTGVTTAMNNVVLSHHESTDQRIKSHTLCCITNTTEVGEKYYLMVNQTEGSNEIIFDHINFTMSEVS